MINELKKLPVTTAILAVTIGYFLLMQVLRFGAATGNEALIEFGSMSGILIRLDPSQSWRLITPIFIHIGWEHFLFNLFSIYIVGRFAEQIWGSLKFFILYLFAGIMGNVFTFFFTPYSIAAGASTSIFGAFAAVAVVGYFGKNPYLKQLGRSYFGIIVVNLVLNLFMPKVGIVGHIGGAIGGVLMAVILPTLFEKEMFKVWQRLAAILAYVLIVLLFFVLPILLF